MRMINTTHDLIPTPNRPPLSGKDFRRNQFDANTRYVFVSIEGAPLRVRFDGESAETDPAHTLANGEKGFWSVTAIVRAKFFGDGTAVLTEFTC